MLLESNSVVEGPSGGLLTDGMSVTVESIRIRGIDASLD